jgi:tetratricopeptide (TPR) repeat protein
MVFPGILAVFLALAAAVALAGNGEQSSTEGEKRDELSCVNALKVAYLALENGDLDQAISNYQEATATATTDALRFQAHFGLGSTYEALSRHTEAIDQIRIALEFDRGHAEAWYTLGVAHAASGSLEKAESALVQAVRLQPDLVRAHHDLCLINSKSGRHEQAVAWCSGASELDPENPEVHIGLGVARYHMGDYPAAAVSFERSLEIDESNGRAIYGLGMCRLYQDDVKGAVAQWVRLRHIEPELAADLYSRIYP